MSSPSTPMSVDARRNQCALFLKALFEHKPNTAVVMWMQAPRWSESKAFLSWQPVVEASFGKEDAYFGCCALKRKPGKGRRGGEAEACFLPAVWADVDIDGSPAGNGGLVAGHAPSRDAAIGALRKLARPTLVVASGFGLHVYWLLGQPLVLRDAGMQRQAKQLVHGLQRRLAHDTGWKIDNTSDLARVLRLPGTLNAKGDEPVDVKIIESGGPRYTLEELQDLGEGFADTVDADAGERAPRTAGESATLIRDGADSGDRHERIWWLAGYLLRREIDPGVALELVQAFNAARVRPPYDEANVKRLFDGILRLEIERRRRESAGGRWRHSVGWGGDAA